MRFTARKILLLAAVALIARAAWWHATHELPAYRPAVQVAPTHPTEPGEVVDDGRADPSERRAPSP